MIKIPVTEIINRIKTQTGLSESEINEKIKEKQKQLSGLISQEGAAHIIANELGVSLIEKTDGKSKIKDIFPGMRDIETVGKVQRKFETREFKTEKREGKVGSMIIGDETGTIRVVLWNDQTNELDRIKEGDIIRIKDVYVKDNNNLPEVHLSDRSALIINPQGVAIDAIKQNESIRKKIIDLTEKDQNIELLGTIVQVFDLRFFEVCPNCNKRLMQREDGFYCKEHNKVAPSYSWVLNLFLDDNSGNIRAVCFKNQAINLLKMTEEQILKFKENPLSFDEIKNNLLGEIVKFNGRTTKNQMFDRLEFIAQRVDPNPDPEEEIKKLEAV